MTGKRKTRVIAGGLVAVSLINIFLLLPFTNGDQWIPKVVRFVITCVFSLCLVNGVTWARGLVGGLSILGAITSIVGSITLFVRGMAAIAGGSGMTNAAPATTALILLGVWAGVMGIYFAWVAYSLFFDKSIASYFNPRGGF